MVTQLGLFCSWNRWSQAGFTNYTTQLIVYNRGLSRHFSLTGVDRERLAPLRESGMGLAGLPKHRE